MQNKSSGMCGSLSKMQYIEMTVCTRAANTQNRDDVRIWLRGARTNSSTSRSSFWRKSLDQEKRYNHAENGDGET